TLRPPGDAWEELGDIEVGQLAPRDDVEILIVANEPVDLDWFPALRLIANFSVGYDRIDIEACRRRGVAVSNTPGVLDAAVAETTGLISRERLALLRDGSTLINTARGAVVDEDALVDELESGRISAGLDVFVHEPHVPERLYGLPSVVLTPHIASATHETRAAMTRIVVDNVLAYRRGEPLPTPVA